MFRLAQKVSRARSRVNFTNEFARPERSLAPKVDGVGPCRTSRRGRLLLRRLSVLSWNENNQNGNRSIETRAGRHGVINPCIERVRYDENLGRLTLVQFAENARVRDVVSDARLRTTSGPANDRVVFRERGRKPPNNKCRGVLVAMSLAEHRLRLVDYKNNLSLVRKKHSAPPRKFTTYAVSMTSERGTAENVHTYASKITVGEDRSVIKPYGTVGLILKKTSTLFSI